MSPAAPRITSDELAQVTGDNDARRAERARINRDGVPAGGTLHVKVIANYAIAIGGNIAQPGESFVAAERAVRDAVARGLLEVVAR